MLNVNPLKDQSVSHALSIERECLSQLGAALGQCAEKLIALALQDARRVGSTNSSSLSTPEYAQQWAYFIGALTPALDHTEMDTKGSDECKSIAKSLRSEIEKWRASSLRQ